jgi:PAS domain S-box-containing protein
MTANQNLDALVNLRRIQLLYSKLPAGIVSALLAMLVIFVVMFQTTSVDLIKAWSSFMLSSLALRGWLWYAYTSKPGDPESAWRWEAVAAFATLLSGCGWAAVNSPFFPAPGGQAQVIFLLIALGIAFSSAVYYGVSNLCYFAIMLPTLLTAIWRFVAESPTQTVPSFMASGLALGMAVAVQQSMRSSLVGTLRQRVESQALLSEQQAIFQSATLGIAVIQDRCIVKANPRLAELFGRHTDEMSGVLLEDLFVRASEHDLVMDESTAAFRRAHSYHAAFRLKRKDGTQFWAELSGRRMDGEGPERSVWLVSEAPLKQHENQAGDEAEF